MNRSKKFSRYSLISLLACLMVIVTSSSAQDGDATRDPMELARRLLGFNQPYAIPLPTPLYSPGDTNEFWVSKAGRTEPTKITATLAAATPNIYVWVEKGLFFNTTTMGQVAGQLDQILSLFRLREVYGDPTILPSDTRISDPTSLLRLPDVDNDPHLYILYAADLGETETVYNFNDAVPAEIAPDGYSNQHELITVNATLYPGTIASDGVYVSLLSRAFYEFLTDYHNSQQAQWLKEALSLFLAVQFQVASVSQGATDAFLQAPNTSLIRPGRLGTSAAAQGGQQLFFDYLIQRFGVGFLQDILSRPGDGVAAIDAALTENQVTDPLTAEIITGREVFADFVMANVLNTAFGDGRYQHTVTPLTAEQFPAGGVLNDTVDGTLSDLSVDQFGSRYIYLLNSRPTRFTMRFDGREMTSRLALPADSDPKNRFYWSGRGRDQDITMTRAFDLTEIERATLKFDIWYDLVSNWNYAYLQISADNGQTWEILSTDATTASNRFGTAYGPGYTGVSNPDGPHPFPILGVVIGEDGMNVNEVVAEGPVSKTDIRAGDKIIGYDEQEWQGAPNVIALLGNYKPGDTLNLYIQRGDKKVSVPVVLGAHPTRIIEPDPLWLPQEVDLSAYAGKNILVRFEYISLPDQENPGIALDNLAIPELDILDDAEGSDSPWILNGWQHVDNNVRQQFLVQMGSIGSQTKSPSVRQLIAPGDDAISGEWNFVTEANELLVFAISGLSDDADGAAQFEMTLSSISE
jgi:Immune inhibitor A peptidase M6/PDZ domain